MAERDDDFIDSQIIAENVGFLDNCFDNSFALQSSIVAAREYIADAQNEAKVPKKPQGNSQNQTLALDTSACKCDLISCKSSQKSQATTVVNSMNKELSAWGLPCEIARKYETRGISQMFDWQVTCLSNSKVLLDCCNLVYSAPTSAGKTLVAEILTIKTILERQKKVIIILPFVSIVREKMFYLQDILSSSGIRVEGFMGSQSPPGGLQAVHVAICTIEKANSLVNRLLDEGTISELGAVIVDELHLLGDPHRGYILELLLTKVKYVSAKMDGVQIQIVGMSATLPNLEVLADWLNAELFITQFRPIPLDEFCLVGKKYYNKEGNLVDIVKDNDSTLSNDIVLKICFDTIRDGCSVLIFCMTKNRCESLAQGLASSFYKMGCSGTEHGSVLREQLKTDSIAEVLEQMKTCPVGLDNVLKNSISFGVAYHHAGLTFDERDIIEGAFKSGAIRVLVATSTLSSGVNLPARKVIIRSPVFLRQPINILTYKQMIGRAGRMGKDTKGESILICAETEKNIGFNLMMGALQSVQSCLESEDKFMRAVLEMIASEVACTIEQLNLYSNCTLLYTQKDVTLSQKSLLKNTLNELQNYELVRIQKDDDIEKYVATSLGKACLSSSMAPNDGLSLFCELQRARQCLVLETDLHLIYLVTPYSVSSQWGDIDWLHLLTLWESLTKAMKRVGELVGVQESFIIRCVRGAKKLNTADNKLNIHKRFYTALALQDLVNEVPLSEVAAKFQCARGFLQGLQQSAATFAGMVTVFSHQLGWKNMEMLISQFQDRLHFGIHSELLDLMKLSSLNGIRARSLFDAGFETVASIASADVNAIENALIRAVPFQSDKQRDDDDSTDINKRKKIKNVWITGCCGMTTSEAADNLITEARQYVQREIGVNDIQWSKDDHNNITISGASKHTLIKNYDELTNIKNEPALEVVTKESESNNNKVDLSLDYNGHHSESGIILEERYEDKTRINNDDPVIGINPADENVANKTSHDYKKEVIEEDNLFSPIGAELPNKEHYVCSKEEIVWESLNITEATTRNISKARLSEKMFSSDVSFSENECMSKTKELKITPKSISYLSNKDVSLFSSDGDNSSLFEDSLPMDLIPSKLFGDTITRSSKSPKPENEVFTVNTNSILDAFQSTICDLDADDEDIKLVYDEDNKLGSTSDSDTCVTVSTCVNVMDLRESKDSPTICRSSYKRVIDKHETTEEPTMKRIKITCNDDINMNELKPKSTSGISDNFTINIDKHEINCFVFRERDVLLNLPMILQIETAAVYLHILDETRNEVIGSNILKPKNLKSEVGFLKGIAIYFGNTLYYFDLTTHSSNSQECYPMLSEWICNPKLKLMLLSSKWTYLHLKKAFGREFSFSCFDISIAEWLVNSEEKEPTIEYLTKKYFDFDLTSITNNSRQRIFAKTWAIWAVAEKLEKVLLERYQDIERVLGIEVRVSEILAGCEYHGLTVDKELTSQLLVDVKNSQDVLKNKAYHICGHQFNFNSSKDVAKVLGIYKGRKVSTKKSVLSTHNTPLSSAVIFWRKLNSILTKTLYPLTEKAVIYSEDNRVKPSYTMFTCSGRMSMHEPNLQNVPRTFSIPVKFLSLENVDSTDVVEFNCRNIFRASPGYTLVSADYCQLEMRILTHYCEDDVLTRIMRSDVDVFKSIAASWSGVSEDEVDDDLRQKAKQLCYGIIYGMGNKTLGQVLDVSEMEAAVFMNTFTQTYPAIRVFTNSVIEDCRRKGYIETLKKRRRYLPDVNSEAVSKKNSAERQAVNTTIQGSAADIAKAAMCEIDRRISLSPEHSRARLILQMHDELIYEVPEPAKDTFVDILKHVMENTVRLKVPLPVKVKSGPTWGSLTELEV